MQFPIDSTIRHRDRTIFALVLAGVGDAHRLGEKPVLHKIVRAAGFHPYTWNNTWRRMKRHSPEMALLLTQALADSKAARSHG